MFHVIFALTAVSFPAAAQNSAAPVAMPLQAGTTAAAAARPGHPPAGIKLEKITTALSVENREPAGESASFGASAGKVICWTKILASAVPAEIKHAWYADGRKVLEITLQVKHHSTRTWSSKSVRPGKWKVEVIAASGETLGSAEFTVTK